MEAADAQHLHKGICHKGVILFQDGDCLPRLDLIPFRPPNCHTRPQEGKSLAQTEVDVLCGRLWAFQAGYAKLPPRTGMCDFITQSE